MGNCQAAEVATVLIENAGGRVERVHWSLSARQVMVSHPGYYVALVVIPTNVNSSSNKNKAGADHNTVKRLKLLRPDDTLHIGHVYRLVSFEDVLKEFGSRKHVRLSRLLGEEKEKRKANHTKREVRRGGGGGGGGGGMGRFNAENSSRSMEEDHKEKEEVEELEMRGLGVGGGIMGSSRSGFLPLKHSQWRPTLQSINEVES